MAFIPIKHDQKLKYGIKLGPVCALFSFALLFKRRTGETSDEGQGRPNGNENTSSPFKCLT